MDILYIICALFFAYSLGCINLAYYWVRFTKHKDLRYIASGTLGTRNVYRNFGALPALGVLLFDSFKLWPVLWLLPSFTSNSHIIQMLAVFAGVMGHIFPIQLSFKGGKGLATFMGSLLYIWIYNPTNIWIYLVIIPVIWVHKKKKQYFEYKIADTDNEFEQIFRLNYETFVEEIPQHPTNTEKKLVDAFHEYNTYVICKYGREVIGMVSYSTTRPFSLDKKVPHLDTYLPQHKKICEIRLLSIKYAYRHTRVCARFFSFLVNILYSKDIDMLIISGTTRQLELYKGMGFVEFYQAIGTAEARYQPMYLLLKTAKNKGWQTC